MKIFIDAGENGLVKSCQDIGRLFYPAADFIVDGKNADMSIIIETFTKPDFVQAVVTINKDDLTISERGEEAVVEGAEDYNQGKRVAKLAVLKAMEKFSGQQAGPWGILTGIRPTKIVQRLLDVEWPVDKIKQHLITGYALGQEKASLLTEIALEEREYLLDSTEAGKLISVYIGIPFCPTRCAYCSFPAYAIGQAGHLVEPFLAALHKEISLFGQYIKDQGLAVQTIYIGGGTPTSLNESQLAALLQHINDNLLSSSTVEFTVEAGRPDTINKEKLQIMKTAGVNRISINPQTMHAETLALIGRNHQPWDVTDAVELAREVGFNNINMDLIIGLPGENLDHIRDTMRYIGMLSPENITLHTLAVKRASAIKENKADYQLPDSSLVEGMFSLATYIARTMAMHPYYMYRQKQMVGQLENVGFAIKGFACVYNIQMIAERQTIIGLGAGASSKFVQPADWTLESFYNPKDPQNYIERIDELCTKKVAGLDKVFKR